ncbi:hypothetical protein [Corynebacterium sp. HMSC073D01]|uniref:hypothetical protein n=1 Tax=Corynebacterium sp. HMSC073D01 TaxID=1739536 RepID=UPI0008A5CB00|nr:hypothetical protein [Corynebacterium sp. HMSC073D01]OFO45272.1 hypothetical protein HMPREF3044_11740 [Corynebacterium sp. HMSC073D01]
MAGFSEAELEAMKQRAAELKADADSGVTGAKKRTRDEEALLAAIEELSGSDKDIAERIHAIIISEAPELHARTWYGFPAYAGDDGNVIIFLQPTAKFGTRYCTLGFNDNAQLDQNHMWPTSYAIIGINDKVEASVRGLVRRAVGK